MTDLSDPKWAKLISLNPSNPDIPLTQPNQHEIPDEWRIYQKSPENTCWIQNLSSASKIKLDNETSLETNEEKEIFNGERISFIPENTDLPHTNSDYVFCLVDFQPKNDLKRPREEPQEPLPNPTEDSKKLLKVENDLQQELTCSICMGLLNKAATLSPCQHTFCSPCLFNHMKTSFKCPLCRVDGASVGKNLTLPNLLQLALNNFPTLYKFKEETPSREIPEFFGTIIRGEVGTYLGAWLDNKREGYGRMVYKNGAMYEGPWRANRREGKGTLTYADGSEYEGDWEHDQRNGHGNMKYQTGNVYNGQWKNGKKEGKGIFITQGGNVYDGEWMNDHFHGEGKYTWDYGDEYEGNFENGALCGYGEMKYANGNVYKGEWQGNQRHGKGLFIQNNGDEYDGEWENDRQHGRGKFTSKNQKRRYEGVWEKGEMSGETVMVEVDGNRPEEEWKKVRRSGRIVKQKMSPK